MRELADWIAENRAFEGKRMPLRNAKFSVPGNPDTLECDYCWSDQQIMYFASGQEDAMKAAMNNGVKCIYGPNGLSEDNKKIIKGMK